MGAKDDHAATAEPGVIETTKFFFHIHTIDEILQYNLSSKKKNQTQKITFIEFCRVQASIASSSNFMTCIYK